MPPLHCLLGEPQIKGVPWNARSEEEQVGADHFYRGRRSGSLRVAVCGIRGEARTDKEEHMGSVGCSLS